MDAFATDLRIALRKLLSAPLLSAVALLTLALGASDTDGDALTYAASGLPAGLSVDPNTGVINGSVAFDTTQTTLATAATVLVTDSEGATATTTFTWTVTPTNRAPVAVKRSISAAEDALRTITLTGTDADGVEKTLFRATTGLSVLFFLLAFASVVASN